ncbi:hypothetical protein [Mycobacteroides chelonae]|uniref:hypothetical protein n=1 Tax=Mycobacteroides chelonae TaxID=1774 RepID=UPI0008AA1E3A|nr:hypothetical protein [Mycobacteroides chelonae]OHU12813.1 hypothetical protein BKG75_17520 [Mycobacteroides chelonae]
MTDPFNQTPAKRRKVTVSEIGYLVRVPGKPWKIKSFPYDEERLAQAYAAEQGGTVEPLPMD